MNHKTFKALRRLIGGDAPYGRGKATISGDALAKLLGYENGKSVRRLEMAPDKSDSRAVMPAVARLMLLILYYSRTHGELPDFDKMESELIAELIAELNEAKDI